MAKYLHLFDTVQDFEAAYNGGGSEVTFECSAGTYYYYGMSEVYIWLNTPSPTGTPEEGLITYGPIPNVGVMTAESYQAVMTHAQEMIQTGATQQEALEYISANFLGALNPANMDFIEITSVNTGGGSYQEPWVSYTKEDEKVHYNK